MSVHTVPLPCPICLNSGVFDSAQSLKDRLIYVSTNNLVCPICEESVTGIDKLTIHLFSHIQSISSKHAPEHSETIFKKQEGGQGCKIPSATHKKTRTTAAKNKAPTTSAPVKYVKIYPKLPVIAVNTVPIIDISQSPGDASVQTNNNNVTYVQHANGEATLSKTENTCNICGLYFNNIDILKMHKCLLHNPDENIDDCSKHKCHLCSKHFKMRGSLMVHLRVAHYGFTTVNSVDSTKNVTEKIEKNTLEEKPVPIGRNDGKPWQCDVCRKSFTTKYFLKKHKRLHTGETPYACKECNKTFTFQQSYHKHLLYHNDEKPHICNYCGRAFKELSTLHNHQRIHTGEKPFSCETCGKCFRQRVSYLVHRRIHTGVMPYKCTACEKSFRYKVSQRTHKCQAQPPGTVVRQTGDLVEKLKKKKEVVVSETGSGDSYMNNNNYVEVSEANAELVRSGAKLSLEDMESDNFSIIAGALNETNQTSDQVSQFNPAKEINKDHDSHTKNIDMFPSNIDDFIDSVPINDKNIPSPSEILRNLCLSSDDMYIGTN